MEENIKWVVWRLSNNRSRGTSGMRVEHLKGWMEDVRKAEAKTSAEEEEETTRDPD